MSFYSVGVGALNAAQLGLATAGHNITNANTPGYHRQGIIQNPNNALNTGAGFIGQGVHVDTVRRTVSQYLETQLLQVQTQSAQLDSYLAQLEPLNNALGSSEVGLSATLDSFFTAVSAVSASPASIPARQSLISNGAALVAQFQSLGQRFSEVRNGVDTQIQDSVNQINTIAAQVASLNKQIAIQSASAAPGQVPNDLLDQREQLISSLNKEVGTTTIIQDDGSATVFFGSGQPLVIEDQVFTLSAAAGTEDPQHLDVAYQYGPNTILIGSNNISGGRLGGLLAFRDQTLNDAQDSLGRVALGIVQEFNNQHALGQDLAGNAGGDFFSAPAGTVKISTNNTGTGVISTTLTNAQHLTTSDYRLKKDLVGPDYTLLRLSDNTATAITVAQLGAGFNIDGITIQLAGVPVAGDTFLLQPTRDIAENIGLAASLNTTTIAAAAPIRSSATLGNLGTGQIGAGSVNSPNNKITITFTAPGTYTATDNTTGAPLLDPLTGTTSFAYVAGTNISINGWTTQINGAIVAGDTFVVDKTVAAKTISAALSTSTINNTVVDVTPVNANLKQPVTITFTNATTFTVAGVGVPALPLTYTYNAATGTAFTFNGWSTKITGVPQTGDTFTVGPNTNGTADNRNALLLAGLQSKSTLVGGTASFEGAFAQMVSLVGNKTSEIQVTAASQAQLVTQTVNAQQAVSGVNLDEEAADLLRFQQAYQAAGKMLQISTSLFDTLLSIGGR